MAGTMIQVRDGEGRGFDLCKYEDMLMPAAFLKMDPPSRMASIKDIPYKDGDVMLCTFAKAGSHWFANLLNLIRNAGPVETAASVPLPLLDFLPLPVLAAQPSPRTLATHLKFDRLPREHVEKRGKMILLLRNPKDSAVSFYLHMQKDKIIMSTQTWESYVTSFLDGQIPFGSIFDYMDSWQAVIEQNKDLDILVVYYEDLKKNGLSELRRVQEYLGYHNDDTRLEQIISRCSLQNLKSDVDTGKTKSLLVDEKGISFLYRKGEIGDWKNHLTEAQNEAFDQIIEARSKNSMFKFQYE